MTAPVARWDFRCNAEGLTEDIILESIKRIAKHFVFQEEKGGTTGYLHYQGRMSLIKKARKAELMKLWKTLDLTWPLPNYLEPTVDAVHKSSDFSYVTKEDTRTRGPWADNLMSKWVPPQYRQAVEDLYPYQRHIFDTSTVFDTRTINFLYCPLGNIGKSTITSWCVLHGKGVVLPSVNDAQALVQGACSLCHGKNERYPSPIFVDLPRCQDKSKLYGIFSAIEQIKNGYLYDLRYKYTEWWIASPQIWVFSNREPDLGMLSLDRWRVWTVDEGMALVAYVPGKPNFSRTVGNAEGTVRSTAEGSVQTDDPDEDSDWVFV